MTAATFRRTKGDIREVVRTIVTSPEFFSRAAYRAKVKSPFEVVVSTMRALDAAPDVSPRSAQLVARLGQPIFGHQAPNGWPETAAPWMNTGAILNRINFGMAAAANRVPGTSVDRWPDAARLRALSRAEQVDGVIASLLLAFNTLILCWPLFFGALLKLALPFKAVRRPITHVMHRVAESWVSINKFWMDQVGRIEWDVQGLEGLDMRHSYLVTSNHQSWVDILVLQYQFNRRIPLLKFFLKQELIWVPVIGLCWWALEFPFMKRFSKE